MTLKPCPFCGGAAHFERMGDRRQSCIVACEDCGARLESNEEGDFCGGRWNTRPPWDEDGYCLTCGGGPDDTGVAMPGKHMAGCAAGVKP